LSSLNVLLGSWSYLVESPIPNQDVYASKWLSTTRASLPIYADGVSSLEPVGYGLVSPNSVDTIYVGSINGTLNQAYVYLGSYNVQTGTVLAGTPGGAFETVQISSVIAPDGNRVYSNGGAEIYYYS